MKKTCLPWIVLIGAGIVISGVYFGRRSGLTIIYTTDIQGRVESLEDAYNTTVPGALTGGIEYYGSFIRRQRLLAERRKQPFLFLDAGNFFAAGSLRSNLSKGRVMVDIFNVLGLDGLAVGLKDYAFGEENLKALAETAKFPFLSGNVLKADGEEFVYIRPYLIKDFPAFRAGIIAVTRPFEHAGAFSGYFEEVKFLNPADTLKR